MNDQTVSSCKTFQSLFGFRLLLNGFNVLKSIQSFRSKGNYAIEKMFGRQDMRAILKPNT